MLLLFLDFLLGLLRSLDDLGSELERYLRLLGVGTGRLLGVGTIDFYEKRAL